jgi:hypothetical protein
MASTSMTHSQLVEYTKLLEEKVPILFYSLSLSLITDVQVYIYVHIYTHTCQVQELARYRPASCDAKPAAFDAKPAAAALKFDAKPVAATAAQINTQIIASQPFQVYQSNFSGKVTNIKLLMYFTALFSFSLSHTHTHS